MENFYYSIPTRVYFGKGQLSHLGQVTREYGSRVLLVYGGGSIKKNGLYDKVMDQFTGLSVTELSGVAPNPRIDSVREGVKLCRDWDVDVVVAVGGGSVTDCAKVVAAGVNYNGDPWDLVVDPSKVRKVLPVICVLTLSATGTEMDPFAVITNPETEDKLGTAAEGMKPVASFLDPEYTFSVSQRQTAAGTADIMSHTLETYFNNTPGADIQAGFAETILRTCIKYGPVAYKEPDNYDARANLMWCSSLAINGLLKLGCPIPWCVHPMEHELSAYYDITHGVGLAILTPAWMEYVLNDQTVDKFVQYGVNVWGIDRNLDKFEIAHKAIDATRNFFKELDIPSTLSEVGIGEEKLELMAKKAASHDLENAFWPLKAEDVLNIYRACL